MVARSGRASPARSLQRLQQTFVADILPRVEAHGHIRFRHVRCHQRKEELVAEMTALCWKWFLRLVRRGKDVLQFVSALVTYAARAVNSGRRVCGMDRAKDVLSPRAQQMHGFTVSKLPDFSTLSGSPVAEALMENTDTPVPEQVSFRVDFPQWRRARCHRDRAMIDRMMLGERTLDLSKKFGVSPGRVSQLRREFHDDWQRFRGDLRGPASRSGPAAPRP
jgi:hypothetical protein